MNTLAGLPEGTLKGYFDEAELSALEAGHDLPLLHRTVDELCLRRVGTVVVNGLIESVRTMPKPLKYWAHGSMQAPESTVPSHVIEMVICLLPPCVVNDHWEIRAKVSVPSNAHDTDEGILLNPNPFKKGIRNPDGIISAQISWGFSDTSPVSSDIVESDQDAYHTSTLNFIRINYQCPWEADTTTIPPREQLQMMLLLGRIAQIPLPHVKDAATVEAPPHA